MLAGFPGPLSLVLHSSESSQLSVPGMLHVPVGVSKAAAERACPCEASAAWPFPAAVARDVIPVLQGCPVLIKYMDSHEDMLHQELPLPEVCWLFTGILMGQTDVPLCAQ